MSVVCVHKNTRITINYSFTKLCLDCAEYLDIRSGRILGAIELCARDINGVSIHPPTSSSPLGGDGAPARIYIEEFFNDPVVSVNQQTPSGPCGPFQHNWVLYTPFRGEAYDICSNCNIDRAKYILAAYKNDLPVGHPWLTNNNKCPVVSNKDKKDRPFTDESATDIVKRYYKGGYNG